MGLFGKKKKAKAAAKPSSYDPPEVQESTSEIASPDDDVYDVVKVDPVKDAESGEGAKTESAEDESIMAKASIIFAACVAGVASVFDGDEDGSSGYTQHKDGSEKKRSKKDEIMDRITAMWAAAIAFWLSLSKITQVTVLAGAAVGLVGVLAIAAAGGRTPMFPAKINVAFVGNSYFYVNDLPRFVEQIAGGHIHQDSVIHNAASILQIIMTGNGMWHKWATKNAMINGVKFETSRNTTEYLYDMGACSVPQLLTGHDKMITYQNQLGSFINDGQNPCFQQDAYREYEESTNLKHSWDFVVITDQSKTMAFEDTRQEALMAFNYTYGPILKKKHISPIIVQPHAYASSGANASGLEDLATFTALIMDGTKIYKKYINRRIGIFAHAHVAPVGNAFLAIYEASPYDLWPKLFLDDGIHPSAYGTFVYGCVIYATMTGYMPSYRRVVVDDMETSDIFATARRLQASSSQAGFPTKDEAKTLYKIVKKVAVKGYKPKSLRGFKVKEADSSFLRYNNDNVYNGNYNGGQQYAQNNNAYNNMYNNQNNNGNNNNGNNNNYYNNGNYNNGNYNNDNAANNDAGNDNGNYNNGNYQVNNYDANSYYNQYANYDDAGEANDEGDYDADEEIVEEEGDAYSYGDAEQYYYEMYAQSKDHSASNVQEYHYGEGNQNNQQYYYSDFQNNDESN